MTGPRCPTCKKALLDGTDAAAFPFCSARCKSIDLGAWLTERYRVPVESPDEFASFEEFSDGEGENR